jgi:predicted alpha/beta superfamily hydrolase
MPRAAVPRARGTLVDLGTFAFAGLAPRRVRVFAPAGYDAARPCPALVLFDGQNVFGDAGSFAGGWHADVAVDALPKRKSRPLVVAIDHGGVARIDELSPWPMRTGHGGALDRLLDGVCEQVVAEVHRRWHVTPGAVGWALGGASLGGLAALYGHLRRPEQFGGALSMSPSLWVAERRAFPFVTERPTPRPTRVYLDCGKREGRGMFALAQGMATLLHARGWDAPGALMWRPDEKGAHSEAHWRRRLPKALRFLYA